MIKLQCGDTEMKRMDRYANHKMPCQMDLWEKNGTNCLPA